MAFLDWTCTCYMASGSKIWICSLYGILLIVHIDAIWKADPISRSACYMACVASFWTFHIAIKSNIVTWSPHDMSKMIPHMPYSKQIWELNFFIVWHFQIEPTHAITSRLGNHICLPYGNLDFLTTWHMAKEYKSCIHLLDCICGIQNVPRDAIWWVNPNSSFVQRKVFVNSTLTSAIDLFEKLKKLKIF